MDASYYQRNLSKPLLMDSTKSTLHNASTVIAGLFGYIRMKGHWERLVRYGEKEEKTQGRERGAGVRGVVTAADFLGQGDLNEVIRDMENSWWCSSRHIDCSIKRDQVRGPKMEAGILLILRKPGGAEGMRW